MVAASSATIVLPLPTSPCSRRFIGTRALEIGGDFRQHPFLRVGGLERQHALERFADARLAHAEGDARLLLRRLLAHRQTQLVEEKFLENQALVRGESETN